MIEKNSDFNPSETSFRIGVNGRPEGTSETDSGVVHYTCNSPDNEILEAFGIEAIGDKLVEKGLCKEGLGNNEVLLIPNKLFSDYGMPIGTVEAEIILAKLSNRNK
jgi:hypothetical protein